MIIHSGHYRPVDAPDPVSKNPDSASINQAALAVQNLNQDISTVTVESLIVNRVNPVIAQADPTNSSSTTLVPDHDLIVTLRVLPKLLKYTGSTRYGLDSKGWGASHDGESFAVVKVQRVEKGSVRRLGRKSCSKNWPELMNSIDNSKISRTIMFSSKGHFRFL